MLRGTLRGTLRGALRGIIASLVLLPMLTVPARAADVGDATVVPVQVTGDPAKRFNLVMLGDGYTAADMPKFRADVDREVGTLLAFEPWKSYRSYLNIYRVEIVSGE